ncbi:MAG TPA: PAS domain S-box protein, partial [Acidobacteriota bacterium]|nr:PAS domain S-box protein [Acidobacteriota bacterium]
MLVTTDEGTILDANPAAARLFACSTVNLRGRRVDDLITETGGPRQTRRRSGLALKATMAPFAARGRCLDGSGIDLMVLVNEMRVGDAHIYVHVLHDISRREQMAAELRREQEFSDTVLETLNSLVVVLDSQGRIVRFNKACERLTGYRFAEVRGRTVWEFLLLPEEVEAVQRETQRLLDKNLTHRFENHWVTRDGRRRLIRWSASYLTGPGEEVEYIIGTGIDITKQVQAQKSLLRSEERLKLTLEAVEDALWDWSIETDELHFSPRWASMLGYSSQELPPRFATFCDLLHPDDAQEVEIGIRRCLSEPDSRFEQEFRLRTRSGEYQWMVGRAKVMERSADGRPQRMLGTCTDITRRKKVEEQLLRAQKMEAVGQLAGGMAHDFNNMLSVITGCLELLEDSLTDKGSRRDPLQLMRMAHGAAQKGARLVKKMLAFSRQQTLEPKVCDLNRLVEGVSDLLHRSLGENIEIELALQRALWKTRVDAGQL